MNRVRWGSTALLVVAAACTGVGPTEAGWFHKKCDNCEKQCECAGRGCEKCEKPRCCFMPLVPPRAAVADAIPGRITTARADRSPLPAAAPALPANNCSGSASSAKLDKLASDVDDLKLQIQALTIAINNK